MKNWIIGIGLTTLLGFTSCDSVSKVGKISVESTSLNHEWILQNDDDSPVIGLASRPVSVSFVQEEGENLIYGFAGCNNFRSAYTAFEGRLSFSDLMRTKLACPQLETEDHYLSLLEKANRYEVKGNNLYLYQGNILLLHFKQK